MTKYDTEAALKGQVYPKVLVREWLEPDKDAIFRVSKKIPRTDEPGPGKYDEKTGEK
jgi:hypothetical protein